MIANNRDSDSTDESVVMDDAGEPTVLQNGRRREIILYLAEQDGEVCLSSLAFSLAVNGDESLSAIIEQLHDHHLPRLVAHDLLRHEPSGVVRLLIEPDRAKALVSRAKAENS